jgi:hypothetical protein
MKSPRPPNVVSVAFSTTTKSIITVTQITYACRKDKSAHFLLITLSAEVSAKAGHPGVSNSLPMPAPIRARM